MNITTVDLITGNLDGTIIGTLIKRFHITSTETIIAGIEVLFIIVYLLDRKLELKVGEEA